MTQLFRMLGWVWLNIIKFIISFSPIEELYPKDESGELMRRYIEYKSWFDRLTSWWVTKPVSEKLSFFILAATLSSVIGLALAALTLVVITTMSISLMLHSLFYTHEQHRHLGAKVFAAEQIASIIDLEASQNFFKGATSMLNGQVEQLGNQQQAFNEVSAKLESESQLIAIKNKTLITLVDRVETEITHLTEQQRTAGTAMTAIVTQAQDYEQHLEKSIPCITAVGESAAQFSDAVQEFKQSQQSFAQAAMQFGLFVSEQVTKKPSEITQDQLTEINDDELMDFLEREIEVNEAFIAQWRQSSGVQVNSL